MTDVVSSSGAPAQNGSGAAARLRKRYAKERRFKLYGQLAIGVAVAFLMLLVGRIVEQGHTAFYSHRATSEIFLDPARVDRAYPRACIRAR